MDALQALLDSFVEKRFAPGASALVYKDGREAFFGCAGVMDLDRAAPFARDSILYMYSMTKVVTAVAIMRLRERGVLGPSSPVADFLPEFAKAVVLRADGSITPARVPLTIGHLLTMTSGVSYPCPGGRDPVSTAYFRRFSDPGEPMDTLAFARGVAACPLSFEPGEQWQYGLSADVLGGVIVAATGMELGEFMRREIFEPLGMTHTGFHREAFDASRVATLYDAAADGEFTPRRELMDFAVLNNPAVEMGGGGLLSTLDDFVRLGEMLRENGKNLLRPETVREMTRNHLTDAQRALYFEDGRDGYGYGYLVRTLLCESENGRYREKAGAFGWNGLGGTTLRVDPARGLTVVLGLQRVPPEYERFIAPFMRAVADAFD